MLDIGLPEWRKLATQVRTDGDALVGRVRAIAAELPDRLSEEVRKMEDAGCSHVIIDRLTRVLTERAIRVAGS
jgi:hypothetical protein